MSRDAVKRYKQYQTAAPRGSYLLVYVRPVLSYETEKVIHKHFGCRDEWVHAPLQDIIDKIEELEKEYILEIKKKYTQLKH